MNRFLRSTLVASTLLASLAWAGPNSYQVTGEVIEVRDDVVVVMKGKEKFEIAKGEVTTAVKVGDKVKVDYKMTATGIELKKK